jgi:hypothetical protein
MVSGWQNSGLKRARLCGGDDPAMIATAPRHWVVNVGRAAGVTKLAQSIRAQFHARDALINSSNEFAFLIASHGKYKRFP